MLYRLSWLLLRSTTLSLALRFGSRWLKLNREERIAYISGVLDTWDDDVALCEKKPEEPWCAHVRLAYEPIVLCSQHRAYLEIVAIVEQYMKEHPQEWERSMAGHIWIALYESCQKNEPRHEEKRDHPILLRGRGDLLFHRNAHVRFFAVAPFVAAVRSV